MIYHQLSVTLCSLSLRTYLCLTSIMFWSLPLLQKIELSLIDQKCLIFMFKISERPTDLISSSRSLCPMTLSDISLCSSNQQVLTVKTNVMPGSQVSTERTVLRLSNFRLIITQPSIFRPWVYYQSLSMPSLKLALRLIHLFS